MKKIVIMIFCIACILGFSMNCFANEDDKYKGAKDGETSIVVDENYIQQ